MRLPAGRALLELPPADRERIEAVIRDLREQANTEAENAWRRRKGPMRPIGEPSQPMRDTLRTQFPGLRRMNANASTTISQPVDRVIHRQELCEAMGVVSETVRRWMNAGKLPAPISA